MATNPLLLRYALSLTLRELGRALYEFPLDKSGVSGVLAMKLTETAMWLDFSWWQ